jgi:hypothetical protein
MSGNKARQANSDLSVVLFVPLTPPCVGVFQSFADLVVIAKEFYPIPFRTRPSKPSASMVLRLKPRESRTLPGLPRTEKQETRQHNFKKAPAREKSLAGVFVCARHGARGDAKASGAFQPSSSADRSAANSFSSMKSGSRYCGKLLDMLSVRSTCSTRPSVSGKVSNFAPRARLAATKP